MTEIDRRDIIVSFRLTSAEAAHLDAAGQALTQPRQRADFARAAALHAAKARVPAPPKTVRRPGRKKPTLDIELLARILGQLGKVGSNLNQIAKAANSNAMPTSPVLARMSIDVIAIRNAVSQALSGGGLLDDDQGGDHGHQG